MLRRTMACLFPAAIVLAAASVLAQTTSYGRIPFTVDPASSYQEGCMNGLCLCPIFARDGLRGRLTLVPERVDGQRLFYDVRDVRWALPSPLLGPSSITGSGTYWIDRAAEQQRMELLLSFDGAPARSFDSGVVPLEGEGIHVALLHEDGVCYGYAFDLVAQRRVLSVTPRLDVPDPAKPPKEAVSWAALKFRYR